MQDVRYTIGAVVAKTGISQHTIRGWERRYAALTPGRTASNQRLYSQADVERLVLLRIATENGHAISRIADLGIAELSKLASGQEFTPSSIGITPYTDQEETILILCKRAVESMDPEALESHLSRGAALVGIPRLLDQVVVPLLEHIGIRWAESELKVSQEHMASAVVKGFLDQIRRSFAAPRNAPRFLVTTPRKQQHEIGALLAALSAATLGWSVIYLGPNLPADEIADAARRCGACAVGLSIVYVDEGPNLATELHQLRILVGPEMPIIIGGRAAGAYSHVIQQIDGRLIHDLSSLCAQLHQIQRIDALGAA